MTNFEDQIEMLTNTIIRYKNSTILYSKELNPQIISDISYGVSINEDYIIRTYTNNLSSNHKFISSWERLKYYRVKCPDILLLYKYEDIIKYFELLIYMQELNRKCIT